VRVLLLDDDPMMRLITVFALGKGGGHEVLEAADTDAALTLLSGVAPPDLLLVDVVLGNEDGVEAAGRLRERLGAVPLVFITGRRSAEDVLRMEAAGARGVIEKPFDPATLADTLGRILGAS
jgi:CheY-like chemotaxis protein